MILEDITILRNILTLEVTEVNGKKLYKGSIKLNKKTLEYFESHTFLSMIQKIESSPLITDKQISKLQYMVHRLERDKKLTVLPNGRIV